MVYINSAAQSMMGEAASQIASQGMVEQRPQSPTGNYTMDQFAQESMNRKAFLDQARMQDVNSQWQRAVASQDNFGSKYQRGRLAGQQLFNDILAPMMAGPGAGGAQGAYEFIKDTNKRIDDAMTNQTSERLKTAQTLNSLADIAGKADKAEWDKLGQTIKIHEAAQRINSAIDRQQLTRAQTQNQELMALERGTMMEDKVREQKNKADLAGQRTANAVEDLTRKQTESKAAIQKLYGEYQKNYQSWAMSGDKQAEQKAKATKAQLDAQLSEYKITTEKIKQGAMSGKAQNQSAESSKKQTLLDAKAKTEGYRGETEQARGKAWGNKASGVDPKMQGQVQSIIQNRLKQGMPKEEMLKQVGGMKDPLQKRLFLDALSQMEDAEEEQNISEVPDDEDEDEA